MPELGLRVCTRQVPSAVVFTSVDTPVSLAAYLNKRRPSVGLMLYVIQQLNIVLRSGRGELSVCRGFVDLRGPEPWGLSDIYPQDS